jgi:RNA polymerase-binding transcription factor DksA
MPSDATISDLRAQLEAERDELRRRLAELGFGDDGGLEYDGNFADSSQVTAERGEAEALARTLRETLTEVEHALSKVADGSFGMCESCGNPIAEPRLEAMPAARFCMDCASKR